MIRLLTPVTILLSEELSVVGDLSFYPTLTPSYSHVPSVGPTDEDGQTPLLFRVLQVSSDHGYIGSETSRLLILTTLRLGLPCVSRVDEILNWKEGVSVRSTPLEVYCPEMDK